MKFLVFKKRKTVYEHAMKKVQVSEYDECRAFDDTDHDESPDLQSIK